MKINLSDGSDIGASSPCNNQNDMIASGGPRGGEILRCFLPLETKDWKAIRATKEGIKLKGVFSYDNGFGEIISRKTCKIFLMFSLLDTGWPLTNTNLDDRMTHVSGECGEIRSKVRQALQSKLDAQKQAEERKKKK